MNHSNIEEKICQVLNIAESTGKELAKQILQEDNTINIMTEKAAGTSGVAAALCQIVGAVGGKKYYSKKILTKEDIKLDSESHNNLSNSYSSDIDKNEFNLVREDYKDLNILRGELSNEQKELHDEIGKINEKDFKNPEDCIQHINNILDSKN